MITLSLNDWWIALTGMEQFFWAVAIFSSVVFILVFVISLLGFDTDSGIDMDIDADVDTGTDADGGDFPFFSLKALTAFATFFSWTGVLLTGEGRSVWEIIPYSIISGLIAMALVVFLLKKFSDFTESGTADLLDLIFEKGDVYIPIPPKQLGSGKIHVTLNKSLRELSAVTQDDQPIKTGEKVRVLEILPENVLLVEKANK
ncbi:MAG TPA: hypothetical protein VKZ54_02595 [Membranihabitans sp.]|nr:hypothetical protein [Membranihabitans sp.]